MSGPKTLTVGITVNLEHYENLRLEVSGEVMTHEDALDLARFLYEELERFGVGDPATRERIENFQKRVFPLVSIKPDTHTKECTVGVCPISGWVNPSVDAIPVTPAPTPTTPEPAMNEQSPVHTTTESGIEAESPVITCEDCGGTVNPAEQKMSMLFTNRTLCRKCLKKV